MYFKSSVYLGKDLSRGEIWLGLWFMKIFRFISSGWDGG